MDDVVDYCVKITGTVFRLSVLLLISSHLNWPQCAVEGIL